MGIGYERPVNQIRVQRLLYLAQGVHLAKFDTPLFEEAIEAWSYGPVIPQVYENLKAWGNKPITSIKSSPIFKTNETIRYAWDIGAGLSNTVLCNWAHSKGSPWEKSYSPFYKNRIEPDLMRDYFRETMKISPIFVSNKTRHAITSLWPRR